jgi:hypothetical protein
MDLYGLQSARAEGNARTQNNDLYNEQILSARDRINNSLDSEKITAQGNLRSQKSTDTQDKVIYSIHDAMSGTSFGNSLTRLSESAEAYNKAKASLGGGGLGTFLSSQIALGKGNVDDVFGSATNTGDKVADVVTNKAEQARQEVTSQLASTDASAQRPMTALERLNQQEAESRRGGLSTISETDDATVPEGAVFSNRNVQNETLSGNTNTPEIPDKPSTSATDELSGKVLSTTEKVKSGISTAGKGLRVLNDVGGAIGTYEMFKNGFTKNADGSTDRWNEVSQIAGAVGTGLDIVGAFIPALEPLGNLAQVVGTVADTIDEHEKDDSATTEAQNDVNNVETQRKTQLSQLPQTKISSAPVNTMVSGGLVGTQSQHINTATQGTGTF